MKHIRKFKSHITLVLVLSFLSCITLSAQQRRDPILDTKVTFNADDATLSSVFKALSRLSNTNIVLAIDQAGTAEKEEKRVTINIKDVPIETAVSLVASSAGLSYRVIGSNTFLVGQKQNIMEGIGVS